jgi:hypothetical protein
MLTGCDARHSQATSDVGFVGGATRDDALQQLAKMHATTLTNTPELLRAQFTTPEFKRPMQVDLTFRDGKLAAVNYIPQ